MTAIPTTFAHDAASAESPPEKMAGWVWAFVFAFGTLGFGPTLFWPARWARFARKDRQFWLDVITAVRPTATTHADSSLLNNLADRFTLPRLAPIGCAVGAVFTGALMVAQLSERSNVTDLWHLLFGGINTGLPDQIENARLIWEIGLSAVFLLHWYAVRSYVVTVQELVQWTNRRAKKVGAPKVKNIALQAGWFPCWVIVAIAFCSFQAWWGIPLAMTAGLARRYAGSTSAKLRDGVSRQLNANPNLPSVGPTVRYCPGPGCGKRLPDAAKYCPRCGTAGGVIQRGSVAA
jgi:hypothetical protein